MSQVSVMERFRAVAWPPTNLGFSKNRQSRVRALLLRMPSIFLKSYIRPQSINRASQSNTTRHIMIMTLNMCPNIPYNHFSSRSSSLLSFEDLSRAYASFIPFSAMYVMPRSLRRICTTLLPMLGWAQSENETNIDRRCHEGVD